jgi:hypothetical protein
VDTIIFNHHIDKHRLADLAMLGKMATLALPKTDQRRIKIEKDLIALEQLIAEPYPSLNEIQDCVEALDAALIETERLTPPRILH